MFVSIFIDYTHGLLVEKYRSNDRKARWFVGQSIVFNLLLLGFFKYGTFFAENLYLLTGISIPEQVTLWEGFTIPLLNIPLPIGISFYTCLLYTSPWPGPGGAAALFVRTMQQTVSACLMESIKKENPHEQRTTQGV